MLPISTDLMRPSQKAGGIFSTSEPSQWNSEIGNSSHLVPADTHADAHPLLGDICNRGFNSLERFEQCSQATNANSGLLGGHHHQKLNAANSNKDSYMCLPMSPMSFPSDKINISGSYVMERIPILQCSSNPDLGFLDTQSPENKRTSRAISLLTSRMGQAQTAGLGGSDHSTQCSPAIPRSPAFIEGERVWQRRQFFQSLNTMQQVQHLQQQHQERPLKRQCLQQRLQPASPINQLYSESACTKILMRYFYQQRQRPADNDIVYWKKFVNEFYSPYAKTRWCTSLYHNVGQHLHRVPWHCSLCRSTTGSGFESTFKVLPIVYQVKFLSGVINELMYLDSTNTLRRLPSGNIMLLYAKAVQVTVYARGRVTHNGQLCVIFTPDLKILSWEFCAHQHEELVCRRTIAHQASQLVQVVQNSQSTISEREPGSNVSQPDLQAISEEILTSAHQLFRSSHSASLDEFGLSVRYSSFLRMIGASNSMGGQIDYCTEQNAGPGDALNIFPQSATSPMLAAQDMECTSCNWNLQHGRTTLLNKQTAQPTSTMINNQHAIGLGISDGGVPAVNSQQNMKSGLNSTDLTPTSLYHLGAPSPSSTSDQGSCISPRMLQNSPTNGIFKGRALQQYLSGEDDGLQKNQDTFFQRSQELQQDGHKGDGTPLPQQPVLQETQGGNMPMNDPPCKSPSATVPNEPGSATDQSQIRCISFKDAIGIEFPEPERDYGVEENTPDSPLDFDLLSSNEFFSDENFDVVKTDFYKN